MTSVFIGAETLKYRFLTDAGTKLGVGQTNDMVVIVAGL